MSNFRNDSLNSLVIKWLEQFRFRRDKDQKDLKPTHTSLSDPKGAYIIPQDKQKKLFKLLHKTIFKENIPIHLTECPHQNVTLPKIDLDFRFSLETVTRKYSKNDIKNIISTYRKAFYHFLSGINSDHLTAFIFERNNFYKDKGYIKDGIHIMFPFFRCSTEVQYLIREYAVVQLEETFTKMGCINDVEEIIDSAVISKNNWFMYGCSKGNRLPYLLTGIYNVNNEEIDIKNYNNHELISMLSIRNRDDLPEYEIKDEFSDKLDKLKNKKKSEFSKKIKKTNVHNGITNNDIQLAKELVLILSPQRAEDYNSWMEVGWCLRNISISLLDYWIEFSKKSEKFKEGICDDLWFSMKLKDDGLQLGSLHRWAKLDSYERYHSIIQSNISTKIKRSMSGTTHDIAEVIHSMFPYQYKFSRNNRWYEFRNHRWYLDDTGMSLKKKIGKEVQAEYWNVISLISREQADSNEDCDADGGNKDQTLIKKLIEVTFNLRDIQFKEKLMKECQILFHDPEFEKIKINSNPDLLCFENGVYDLSEGTFRDGRPEDNITMTTGIDYVELSDETKDVEKEIKDFISQIFVNKKLRKYFWILGASFLEGRNPNEKFHIWNGSGGNGKSKLVELLELSMGEYCSKLSVALLTQKRTASNSANPEVIRLRGARLVTTQEPEENDKFNVGIMKEWTGNDKILARGLYMDPIEFKPQFKIVLCCNQLLKLPSDDEGTWRRISKLDFMSSFKDYPDDSNPYEFKKDKFLVEKLYSWKEVFISMLIEKYKIYKADGLQEPKEILETTRAYQKMNDMYEDFIQDNITKENTNECLKKNEIFSRFKEWWKDNGVGDRPDSRTFYKHIEKKLGKYSNNSGWKNMKLTENDCHMYSLV